jgi:hypothetical protein
MMGHGKYPEITMFFLDSQSGTRGGLTAVDLGTVLRGVRDITSAPSYVVIVLCAIAQVCTTTDRLTDRAFHVAISCHPCTDMGDTLCKTYVSDSSCNTSPRHERVRVMSAT